MEIISVDINSLVIPKYCHYHTSFVVLFDPTVEEIISKAEHDSKVFIFSFFTGEVDDLNDMTVLENYDNVAKPTYIGNFRDEDFERVVFHFLKGVMGKIS